MRGARLASLDAGFFNRAFAPIWTYNVRCLVAAAILYSFPSGARFLSLALGILTHRNRRAMTPDIASVSPARPSALRSEGYNQ